MHMAHYKLTITIIIIIIIIKPNLRITAHCRLFLF